MRFVSLFGWKYMLILRIFWRHIFKKRMHLSVVLVAGQRIQIDLVQAGKQIDFHIGVDLSQLRDQMLGFLPLGSARIRGGGF